MVFFNCVSLIYRVGFLSLYLTYHGYRERYGISDSHKGSLMLILLCVITFVLQMQGRATNASLVVIIKIEVSSV